MGFILFLKQCRFMEDFNSIFKLFQSFTPYKLVALDLMYVCMYFNIYITLYQLVAQSAQQ